MRFKLLVITPVRHIDGVAKKLELIANVTYRDDPTLNEILPLIKNFDAVYTNPNKSRIFIGKELIDAGKKLKVICTASTGTNHIDIRYARKKGVEVLSLREERDTINQISSTAEHAFSLTMASLRHILNSHNDVLKGIWDYEKFIGRQMNGLTIGVIGYGRLGEMYTNYCLAFGSRVLVYDPYKEDVDNNRVEMVNRIGELLKSSDVISFHVHVTDETKNMVDYSWFSKMKPNVLMVNTSRGDIIVEKELVEFLSKNIKAMIATDVLADEIRNREDSPLLNYASRSSQVIITPHIGGMTKEAQEIAYNHAAKMLETFIIKN